MQHDPQGLGAVVDADLAVDPAVDPYRLGAVTLASILEPAGAATPDAALADRVAAIMARLPGGHSIFDPDDV